MPANNNSKQKDPAQTFADVQKDMKDLSRDIRSGRDESFEAGENIGKFISNVKGKASADAGMFGSASIIGKASKNIFEFPVFISSNVSVDFATATNSLLEQVYASYLQMAISMNPVVSERDIRRGLVFQNLKTDTTKYLEYATQFYAQEACHNVIEMDDAIVEFDMVTLSNDDYKHIQESLDYQPLSEFSHYFMEADADDDDDEDDSDLKEREYKLKKKRDEREERREQREIARDKRERAKSKRESEEANRRKAREEEQDRLARERDLRERKKDLRDKKTSAVQRQTMMNRDKREAEKHAVDMAVDAKVKAPQFIDETKIQKLNTLKPLMMTVGVKVVSDKTGAISNMIDYVVGVKTHSRIIPADILPEVAEYPTKEMNRLARKAKWRAGEIKFMDYLFNRPAKKQAAIDSKDVNKRWYHRLYTLAHSKGSSSVAKKVTGKRSPEGLIPNVTIIMTKQDVDRIDMEKGIDLMKGSTAVRFCKELFLMALIVVDTDAQSLKILLPDINNDYEIHSLASIQKQIETLDTANAVSREVKRMMNGR